MRTERALHVDIETFSATDLRACGVYKYAEDPAFDILLLAYAYDDDPVRVIDLARGETLPEGLVSDIIDEDGTGPVKVAYNAAFERVCLSRYLGRRLAPDKWLCTMIQGAAAGYPMGLNACGAALGLPQDKAKLAAGRALIRRFCAPAAVRGGGYRVNTPDDYPGEWESFKVYVVRDVEAEREVFRRTSYASATVRERTDYMVDQVINDRGVLIDTELVAAARRINGAETARHTAEAAALTGLANPNSRSQLKAWVEASTGAELDRLDKAAVSDLLRGDLPDDARRALELRQKLSKSSIAKYDAMARAVCDDGSVRGSLQFYGAARTGRWAGRLLQVQNLPQNHLDDIAFVRRIVRAGDTDTLAMLGYDTADTLSQLIRTAIVAPEGCAFAVADYSAIEARMTAYLCGEEWQLEVFRGDGKIYEATAAQMFHVPVESIGKGSPERQRGKVASLALGYQGGVGALNAMGADRLGMSEAEKTDTVTRWRAANKRIVKAWGDLDTAAKQVIAGGEGTMRSVCGTNIYLLGGRLVLRIPGGRRLHYVEPRIEGGRITYAGQNSLTKKWERIETYGGKLLENIVQATCRDILAEALRNLYLRGFRVVMHVHDEAVAEVPADGAESALAEMIGTMETVPSWLPGFPLRAAGFTSEFYKKD